MKKADLPQLKESLSNKTSNFMTARRALCIASISMMMAFPVQAQNADLLEETSAPTTVPTSSSTDESSDSTLDPSSEAGEQAGRMKLEGRTTSGPLSGFFMTGLLQPEVQEESMTRLDGKIVAIMDRGALRGLRADMNTSSLFVVDGDIARLNARDVRLSVIERSPSAEALPGSGPDGRQATIARMDMTEGFLNLDGPPSDREFLLIEDALVDKDFAGLLHQMIPYAFTRLGVDKIAGSLFLEAQDGAIMMRGVFGSEDEEIASLGGNITFNEDATGIISGRIRIAPGAGIDTFFDEGHLPSIMRNQTAAAAALTGVLISEGVSAMQAPEIAGSIAAFLQGSDIEIAVNPGPAIGREEMKDVLKMVGDGRLSLRRAP